MRSPRACQDPDIQRWTTVPVPYEPRHARDFVTTFSDEAWRSGSGTPMGVFDASTGELLGSMGLKRDVTDRGAELGYWTAPGARGRGVATRAGRALARLAFDALDTRRITWRALVGNHGSKLVAQRIGVTVDGVARAAVRLRDGSFADAWIGSLLPGELRTATPPALAPGSAAALQATTFGRDQPRLTFPADGPPGCLRPQAARDVEAQLRNYQDPEAVRWTNVPLDFTVEQAAGNIADAAHLWQRGEGARFTIAGEDDEYVGVANLGIYGIRELTDTAEIGFVLSPEARGHGYATAAVRTISEWGLDSLGLARIVWRAHVGNDASRRVAAKAGFVEEGTQRLGWRQRGELRDVWTAARTAADPR
jgi:RimJ/RimL family protein N-acetyltransferase